jgi:hypothetical protein
MEVDLVITLESHPTELEVVSGTINNSSTINIYGDAQGFEHVQAPAPTGVNAFSSDATNPIFFNAIVKSNKVPIVRTSMDVEVSI